MLWTSLCSQTRQHLQLLNVEEEVDFHFVCFINSNKISHLYELDGDQKIPNKDILLTSGAGGGLRIWRRANALISARFSVVQQPSCARVVNTLSTELIGSTFDCTE